MMRLRQRGVSTVGAAATVAAVGLLAFAGYVLVMPAYHDGQVQTQVAEVFVSVDACRADVARVVQTTTAKELSTALFGCDGGASSGAKISKHLKSIAVGPTGAITVMLDFRTLAELTPTTSTLTAIPLSGPNTPLGTADVQKPLAGWRCGSPQDGTTVPAKYLPSGCRG